MGWQVQDDGRAQGVARAAAGACVTVVLAATLAACAAAGGPDRQQETPAARDAAGSAGSVAPTPRRAREVFTAIRRALEDSDLQTTGGPSWKRGPVPLFDAPTDVPGLDAAFAGSIAGGSVPVAGGWKVDVQVEQRRHPVPTDAGFCDWHAAMGGERVASCSVSDTDAGTRVIAVVDGAPGPFGGQPFTQVVLVDGARLVAAVASPRPGGDVGGDAPATAELVAPSRTPG